MNRFLNIFFNSLPLILLITLILLIIGWFIFPSASQSNYDRFDHVYEQRLTSNKIVHIIKDKKTGIKYVYVSGGFSGGMTKLEEKYYGR